MYAFFEDRRALPGEPAAWCFSGLIDCLTVSDASKTLSEVLETLAKKPGWTIVALDYELGYLLEPKSAPADWPGATERPLARFWRFAERAVLSGSAAEDWLAERAGAAAGVGGLHAAVAEDDYLSAVDRIQQLIAAGDCYQVNYTFPLQFQWFGHPLAIYRRLRQLQPVRYGGFVGDEHSGLVSLSPELFVERQGARLLTRPMKGTLPRGLPAEQLRDSAKDRAENLMIVDLLRNDLGRIAENGSVVVDRLFEIEDYPTVWQMVSEVSARIGDRRFVDVLRALFPCGSITGAPKIRAQQIAAELESGPRGLYTGALGWLAPNGDFRLNVAIRTLELAPGGVGRMGVGSGVVADSNPAAEWQECLLKAGFLRECDPGLRLIETLRREDGRYPLLDRHLARLRRSAAWFGFALDECAVLRHLEAQPGQGLWRVRLTLGHGGDVSVQSFPLSVTGAEVRYARLAEAAIDSTDPLRQHKTSERQCYDEALASLVSDPAIFDMVFLNERGEVAEGARSNVFVERDGILLTPPLSSGCLAGVLRAELLACGRAQEEVLLPQDLSAGFLLGNALRGLIRVELDRQSAV